MIPPFCTVSAVRPHRSPVRRARRARFVPAAAFVLLAGSALLAPSPGRAYEPAPLPSWQEVEAAVLGALPGREAVDLLSRKDADAAFDALAAIDWAIPHRQAFRERFLADDDELIRELRTPAGTKFMRHVGTMPEGYDRLDRLRRMPHGSQRVKELVKGPDGHKLIEYMTETDGGRKLGRQLSQAPRGTAFNAPTGRIYSVRDFLSVLRREYDAEVRSRAGSRSAAAKPAAPVP
jgi:hypothetical protein